MLPYNAQSGTPRYSAPSADACKAFKAELVAARLFVKIRWTKGADKMAACGQLGNLNLRRELRRRRLEYAEAAGEGARDATGLRAPSRDGGAACTQRDTLVW